MVYFNSHVQVEPVIINAEEDLSYRTIEKRSRISDGKVCYSIIICGRERMHCRDRDWSS